MLDPDGGKQCTKCAKFLRASHFNRDKRRRDGLQSQCRMCRAELYGQVAEKGPSYDYARMGRVKGQLQAAQEDGDFSDVAADEIACLADAQFDRQERSTVRAVSVAAAANELHRQRVEEFAKKFLSNRVAPKYYATKRPRKKSKRTVTLLLSDLHIGARLLAAEEPQEFGPIQERRRLEYVARQAADYKPQYRDHSELLILLNGDVIEGDLGHDKRSGDRLAEQKVTFWHYFRCLIGFLASVYPRVRVACQAGNHGRDIVRHKDRATTAKWDGHEWELYVGLSYMCDHLKNVKWDINRRAYTVVDVHGHKLLLTHGDTELKLGNPFSKGDANLTEIHKINSTQRYGCVFDVACFGHFHTGLVQHAIPTTLVWNGALIPPNGWARTKSFTGYPCGQYLFESVEGYPFGDSRFLQVGPAQDNDNRLGEIITPCREIV